MKRLCVGPMLHSFIRICHQLAYLPKSANLSGFNPIQADTNAFQNDFEAPKWINTLSRMSNLDQLDGVPRGTNILTTTMWTRRMDSNGDDDDEAAGEYDYHITNNILSLHHHCCLVYAWSHPLVPISSLPLFLASNRRKSDRRPSHEDSGDFSFGSK